MTQSTVEELLKRAFEQYQVLWYEGRRHTHIAHHLGSLALLGASDQQLKDIYDSTMSRYSDEYTPSPHEITKDNWRESLGDTRFCLAYRDYFNKELPTDGDWKKKFFELFVDDKGGSSLIDGCFSGLLHPLIHMDYAIELNSRIVACEALTMAAVVSDRSQQVVTNLKPPTKGSKRALQILKDIGLNEHIPDFGKTLDINSALSHESLLRSAYNDWDLFNNLDKTIEELFDMSVYLYGATHKPDQIDFDFVLLHFITGMHAIRKLRSYFDDNTVRKLLCGFFYVSIAIYISQHQPKIDEHLIDDYKMEENKNSWKYVIDKTLHTKLATEVHLVKVIRALKDAETDYGSKEKLYLTTAVKTVDNLNQKIPWNYYQSIEPWIGSPDADRDLNIKE